jgi:tRNA(Ile)-lysidine synthase
MLDRFKQSLFQSANPDPARSFLVGVSGGVDSLALLFLLNAAGFLVIAAYFDHSLRPQSEAEAGYIGGLADQLKVPFVHAKQDVRGYAEKHGLTIEAAGRALRYSFLFEQAQKSSAQAVVVAHHADDQVETVLLHLLRGSGVQGLQGMSPYWLPNPWSISIPLLRPLLPFWKYELEAYLQALGVQAMQDETNLDPVYLRNRLRHTLLPSLEQIQPGVKPALLRLARIAQDEQAWLEPLVDAGWQTCLRRQGEHFIVLSVPALREQPLGLQRRICRRALAALLPGLPDVDFNAVERMIAFIKLPARGGQLDLVAGLRLLREGNDVWLAVWEAELPSGHWPQLPEANTRLQLQVPGQIDLPDGWILTCRLEENVEPAVRLASENSDLFQTWLDFERSGSGLQLRTRWEGAQFQPLGLNGQTQKVTDRMIDAHLPSRARRCWPLLCAGDQILWIPGLAAAHPARLTARTRQVLYMRIQQI